MTEETHTNLNHAAVSSGLDDLIGMDGVIAVALVYMADGSIFDSRLTDSCEMDITLAARVYAQIFRAQRKVIKVLKEEDVLEDIQVTQLKQYHLMMKISSDLNIFMLLIMARNEQGTLGMVRLLMSQAQKKM